MNGSPSSPDDHKDGLDVWIHVRLGRSALTWLVPLIVIFTGTSLTTLLPG